jgi:hypothetical protein
MATRAPQEIRESVRDTRRDLEYSIGDFKAKIAELTDWKKQLSENRQTALIVAGVGGFVVGGGIAGIVGLFKS